MSYKRKIVFLSLLFFTVHTSLYLLFYFVANKKDAHRLQFNNYKKCNNYKILFLGDSHAVRSVDFSSFDSTFSLAFYGENNMMNYYKLKYIIDQKLKVPKYIILPCDILSHTYGFNVTINNKSFYYNFINYKDVNDMSDNKISAYFDYYKIKLFPYIDWQYALNEVNADREKKANNKFFEVSQMRQKKAGSFLIQDELLFNREKKSYYNQRALLYIQKTIDLCKINNIKPIYVKYPLTSIIFDEIKYNLDSNYITNRPAENIIHKNNLPILDFEYLYKDKLDLFFDSHHLNNNGKALFTPILKHHLDSLTKLY